MKFIVFGANNPTGCSFLRVSNAITTEAWGRKAQSATRINHIFCDLSQEPVEPLAKLDGVLVSFAPIWLLAPFLQRLSTKQPQVIKNLLGVIACSSSSYMTKRFAFNRKDIELASELNQAHQILDGVCKSLGIPLQILAPTLVYGNVDGYKDRNINKLIEIMRASPALFLPHRTGLRQPIHAGQLAGVAFHQAKKILEGNWQTNEESVVTIGGDEMLSYEEMVQRIQLNLRSVDRGKHCRIIKVPDEVFYTLSAPILPINPKLFEAVMRIKSNLSGFKKAHAVTNADPQSFPVPSLGSEEWR